MWTRCELNSVFAKVSIRFCWQFVKLFHSLKLKLWNKLVCFLEIVYQRVWQMLAKCGRHVLDVCKGCATVLRLEHSSLLIKYALMHCVCHPPSYNHPPEEK